MSLSTRAKASYAVGDMGLNVYWQGMGLFLFFFYTDVMGLPARWAGITILVASIWDAISDVIIAGIADRTHTRIGRYRPYLLYAALPLGVGFMLAFFVPPGLSGTLLIAYALGSHLLLRTLYTLVSIPYSSLSVRMTTDSLERGILAGWRMQAAALGGLITAFATPSIVSFFTQASDGNTETGWLYAATAMALVATGLIWACFLGTKERLSGGVQSTPHSSLRRDFSVALQMLYRNPPLRRVFICIMMSSLCLAMLSKTLLYWFKYAVGDEASAGLALAITPIVLLFMAPVWARLSVRVGKREAWLIGCAIALIGYIAFFIAPMRQPLVIYLTIAGIAVGSSAFAVMFWAMLPDTVEYDHAVSGERHEAKVFGFASFAQKAALGANAFFLGFLLDLIGFAPNQTQAASTLLGMKAIMSLVPALGVLITMLSLWNYRLNANEHKALLELIRKREDSRITSSR